MIHDNTVQHRNTKSVAIDKLAAPSCWPTEIERIDLEKECVSKEYEGTEQEWGGL
ncbi:MAG: hypothetical protein ABSE80_08525 [Halobacteriota archaeon]|jgi:hypothetical protein